MRDKNLRETINRWIVEHVLYTLKAYTGGFVPEALSISSTSHLQQVHLVVGPPPSKTTVVDNIFTWDKALLVASMVGGFEMDFPRI